MRATKTIVPILVLFFSFSSANSQITKKDLDKKIGKLKEGVSYTFDTSFISTAYGDTEEKVFRLRVERYSCTYNDDEQEFWKKFVKALNFLMIADSSFPLYVEIDERNDGRDPEKYVVKPYLDKVSEEDLNCVNCLFYKMVFRDVGKETLERENKAFQERVHREDSLKEVRNREEARWLAAQKESHATGSPWTAHELEKIAKLNTSVRDVSWDYCRKVGVTKGTWTYSDGTVERTVAVRTWFDDNAAGNRISEIMQSKGILPGAYTGEYEIPRAVEENLGGQIIDMYMLKAINLVKKIQDLDGGLKRKYLLSVIHSDRTYYFLLKRMDVNPFIYTEQVYGSGVILDKGSKANR